MSSDISASSAASTMDPTTYYASVYAQGEQQSVQDQGNVQSQAEQQQKEQNADDDQYTLWV